MGNRGPIGKTDEELKLSGSRRARKCVKVEPGEGVGRCPAWLDAESRETWTRLSGQLGDRLHPTDANILARYCRIWARWVECERILESEGMTYTVRKMGLEDTYRARAEVGIANALAGQLLTLEKELGLTPAARARVGVPPKVKVAANPKLRFFPKTDS